MCRWDCWLTVFTAEQIVHLWPSTISVEDCEHIPYPYEGWKKLHWKLPICLAHFYGVQSPRKAVDFWQSNDLFNPIQYMFLKGRSTVSQLLSRFNDWMESTDVMFLNFSQVYDSVPLGRLLVQLVSWNRRFLTKLLNQSSATSRSAWSSLMWHEVTLKERFWVLSFFLSTSTTYRLTFPLKSNVRRRHQIYRILIILSLQRFTSIGKSPKKSLPSCAQPNSVRHHTKRN